MAEPEIPIMSTDDVAARLAGRGLPCWLVHATDRSAFRDGHIPGALDRPDGEVLLRLAGSAALVVYGEDERSLVAPGLVASLRSSDVEVAWYAGGLAAWRRAGRAVERAG